jgi:transposase
MAQIRVSTSSEQSIYAALELSKNSWLLAIQFPGRDKPSLYPIRGGDAEGLMAKLDAARKRRSSFRGGTSPACIQSGAATPKD